MNSRNTRNAPSRSGSALIHRGPQAFTAPHVAAPAYGAPLQHAPNAALLIDFDNVTMGIRSDLGKELRTLLGSDIIKGKVAVQRAYADWRRYPQYIVPLAESSIDMIMAPAYGASKKNATDIRLAIDAMELVFTRPEIGTYILLSGDSDFASLVMKLKEYGKYVIGVGIRESSSDLLVMNCDEYYSYNTLAGLVKSGDEEPSKKWDPWELVVESVNRMKRNNDVMRSDRLKQVMQEIDSTFDEKDDLGMSKFSRFVQEAVTKGLISATKLENGQLEIGLPGAGVSAAAPAAAAQAEASDESKVDGPAAAGDDRGRAGRPRRGRRGRGGRDREDRPRAAGEAPEAVAATPAAAAPVAAAAPAAPAAPQKAPTIVSDGESIGLGGERLTRDEAFDLLRQTMDALVKGDGAVRASTLRAKAREVLGRDSESLSDRNFPRILKDAHDSDVIDLRRRGDDFEVARVGEAPSVADQLTKAASAAAPAATAAPTVPRGMAPRGGGGSRGRGGRPGAPPADLLSIGVVRSASSAAVAPAPSVETAQAPAAPAQAIVSQASPAAAAPAPVSAAEGKPATKAAKKAAPARKQPAKSVPEAKVVPKAAPKPKVKEGAPAAAAGKKPRAKKAAQKGAA